MYASKNGTYEHFWLCSGQDYPLRSASEICNFLHSNSNINFVQLWPSKNYVENSIGGVENNLDKRTSIYFPQFMLGRGRLKKIIKRCFTEVTGGYNHTFTIFRRKNELNLKFYFGSQWVCLSKEFIDWIQNYLVENPNFIKYFINSNCPDECFFQTLLMNSPYKKMRKDYLHCASWESGKNSPRIMTMEDYNTLINSNKLMARKFDINVSSMIIDAINCYINSDTI